MDAIPDPATLPWLEPRTALVNGWYKKSFTYRSQPVAVRVVAVDRDRVHFVNPKTGKRSHERIEPEKAAQPTLFGVDEPLPLFPEDTDDGRRDHGPAGRVDRPHGDPGLLPEGHRLAAGSGPATPGGTGPDRREPATRPLRPGGDLPQGPLLPPEVRLSQPTPARGDDEGDTPPAAPAARTWTPVLTGKGYTVYAKQEPDGAIYHATTGPPPADTAGGYRSLDQLLNLKGILRSEIRPCTPRPTRNTP